MTATPSRLLDAAHALILERGYNAFSYADLAEQVGIRKASIHHHFPTKADLVEALLLRYRQRIQATSSELASQVPDPHEQIEMFLDHWTRCIEDKSEPICLALVLAAELPSLPGKVAAAVSGHFVEFGAALRHVIEAAGFPSDEAAGRAEAFMALFHGAMISARASGDPACFARVTRVAMPLLLAKEGPVK
jgi:TetR/AcrR family transcriptional repressor of nem operon